MLKKAIFNWSSGKDSALALYKVLQSDSYHIHTLLTSVNDQYDRISMHGVRTVLLEQQARQLGLPLYQLRLPEMASMEVYNSILSETMQTFKRQGVDYSIFGDIFLEDLKVYRETQLQKVNIEAVFPLWQQPTRILLEDFIALGFKAVIVCVNEKYLNRSFAGRLIDQSFLSDLPANVDPCGENGEYHSFVFDGPIFKAPVSFNIGETVYRKYERQDTGDDHTTSGYDTGFYYCDLLPT